MPTLPHGTMMGMMLDRPSTISAQDGTVFAPLVMLPGTLCDERIYTGVLSRLEMPARIVPLAGADSAGDMARRILAQAPERISLCGFSLGAIVALEIVSQAPERVERLALIACNPGILPANAARVRAGIRQSDFHRGETTPHLSLLEDMARDTTPTHFAEQTAITLSRADSRRRLGAISIPTLVLCGAEDKTCPPKLSREIAAAIPHAHLAIVERAGHYVTLDAPDTVAAELAAWLVRRSSSVQ